MKLVIALDLPTPEENLALVRKISTNELDVAFKVGLNTFVAAGPDFVKDIKKIYENLRLNIPDICLDLKLYDIPNTMASAAKRIAELGVSLMTIHASAGEQGMRAVVEALKNVENAPKILAVTVLTSFTHDHCVRVYNFGRKDTTQRLAAGAISAGVDGIVCSAHDLETIRNIQDSLKPRPSVIKFVPGIELKPRDDDQNRKGTLKDVIQGGADYIVVGRPIYKDDNPRDVVANILEKIGIMEMAWKTFNETSNW